MRCRSLLFVSFWVGCGAAPAPDPVALVETGWDCTAEERIELAEDLALICLEPGIFRFVALAPADFSLPGYPANGLLIEVGDDALLVDTGWRPEQAEQLMTWASDHHHPVRAVVVTHSHDDRIGGADAVNALGIPLYALDLTQSLANEHGASLTSVVLEPDSIPELQWLHPGPGHSADNLVIYHRASGLLFGGCMVKEEAATDLGNVADADLLGWAEALRVTARTFPSARVVVPGHGEPGDLSLIQHTLSLLETR